MLHHSMFDLEAKKAYSQPGIFEIYCTVTDSVLIGESENAFETLRDIYYSLQNKICENEKLLQDYKNYSEEDFRFEWVDIGPHLKDPEIRKQRVEELKSLYEDNFY